MSVYGERLVRVEEEIKDLKASFEEHKEETNKLLNTLDSKMDDVIALRNKGAGILWVLSGLIGTGIVGGFIELFHWFGFGVK